MLFARMVPVGLPGIGLELPDVTTLNVPSALLTVVAGLAAFHFGFTMIPLLLACSEMDLVYFLLTGAVPAAH